MNILIDNTHDHAKNHAFLHQGGENWRLSPVYDVQPQVQGIPYQQLIVGDHGTNPTLANALSQASRFSSRLPRRTPKESKLWGSYRAGAKSSRSPVFAHETSRSLSAPYCAIRNCRRCRPAAHRTASVGAVALQLRMV
ncbi:HipA domain-containing protein [Cupriavidus sp. AcVe19-6a]|nr:HipA domain-containing protein [Cupriavidus sp. AcVe19-6a]